MRLVSLGANLSFFFFSHHLARFTSAIIEVEGPPELNLKEETIMNDYRVVVMRRTFETFEDAENFAEKVNGDVIYDKTTGLIIVAW